MLATTGPPSRIFCRVRSGEIGNARVMPQSAAVIRSYRIYFRDARNGIARSHEADLATDDDARQLVALMLDEQPAYPCAEVWDRSRLVCTVRRMYRSVHQFSRPSS